MLIMDTSKFATKSDINNLQSDIQKLEKTTKADISRLEQSTKADMKKLATKTELSAVKADTKSLKLEIKYVRQDLLRLEERVENVEEGIKDLRADNQKLDIKLDRLQNTLDGFVGRVDDLSVENEVGAHHTRELQIKVDDHDRRLKHIESSKSAA